jgi:hypothetical protein
MKKIDLSPPGSTLKHARLDPAVLVDTRMMLCANSGGGKSHALRLIAEQVGNLIPTIILDPEGEWATLRTHVHAVLVGPGGDVQAEPKLAKKLARRLVEVDCSAVVDLSELKAQPKRAFVREFLEGLLSVPRKFWGARLVILDEAHKFAPESGRDAESRQAVIDLMDSGRKRGLGGVLATQRLSKIAKDAVAEANNLMLGRFAQDVDLRRASDLLGFTGRKEWDTIRNLKPGEFMALGPAFNHNGILAFRTSNELQTEHPKPGARHLVAPPKPSKKVKGVLAKLGDLPQEAAAELEERAELRKRVRELEGELRKAERGGPSQAVDDLVAGAVLKERKIRDKLVQAIDANHKRALGQATRRLGKIGRDLQVVIGSLGGVPLNVPPPEDYGGEDDRPIRPEREPEPPAAPRERPAVSADAPSSGAAYRLIVALLQQGKPTSRPRAALLSQLSPKSSTFRNAMSTLRNADPPLMRDVDNGELEATEDAHAEYGAHYEPLPTGDGLVAYWRGRLGGADQRLFDVLVEDAGEPIGRTEAADRAELSPKSSTFRNAMSKLRRLGLMADHGSDLALGKELLQ